MPEMVLNCPHCGSEKVGFEFGGERKRGTAIFPGGIEVSIWNTFWVCRKCREGVVVKLQTSKRGRPSESPGDPRDKGFQMIAMHPKPYSIGAPEHVPIGIAQDYKEASDSLRRENFTSAGLMFRKVLEQATLALAPDQGGIRKKRLLDRIDALAGQHLLTPSMRDWAHIIRLEGNEAAHEEQFTQERATQMKEFAELFLLYAFTLPTLVKEAHQKAEDSEPSDSS